MQTLPNNSTARIVSGLMLGATAAASVLIVAVLGLVLAYLLIRGLDGLSIDFFTRMPTGDPKDPGGLRHGVQGTLILIGVASAIGVPVGLLCGVYLAEYSEGSRLAGTVRFVCDVLAGVPSIVVGILGYELLVRPLGNYNGWAGAGALAFIMIPIVARTTEEMLRLVPRSYREGSLALGATKAQTITRVVLPAAAGSVVTGVMLAIARVAGETAPLLFTVFGSRFLPGRLSDPFPSLTIEIFGMASGAAVAEQRLAWAGILVLVSLLFVLNLTIRAVTVRSVKRRVGSA